MNNLKALRERAHITQHALAGEIGCTQPTISHYESGRRVPSLAGCRRIVRALNAFGSICSLAEAFPDQLECPADHDEILTPNGRSEQTYCSAGDPYSAEASA